jgi:hypothetical protein
VSLQTREDNRDGWKPEPTRRAPYTSAAPSRILVEYFEPQFEPHVSGHIRVDLAAQKV